MLYLPSFTRALFVAFLFCGGILFSQNLLKNPSFEAYRQCPDRLGNFHADVEGWSSPTHASTDYFNACSTSMGTPENFNGQQTADFGKGYAGLYLFAPNDYREYIQGELLETLQKGRIYRISFYVSLAERSDFAVREFGMVFSNHKLDLPIKKELSKMQLYRDKDNSFSFLQITHSNFYNETTDWVYLEAEFSATGTENFVTIGNFENNARTRTFRTSRNAKQGAYYYIDMVAITPVGTRELSSKDPSPTGEETYSLNTEHLFRNVLFGFDEYQLNADAKAELHRLYDYLLMHPDLRITINGHTDNFGSAEYNRGLSEHRCKTVAEFLLAMGLPVERIAWISHGYEQPIADNETEEGRQKNRRVAFSLSRDPTAQ